MKVTIFSSITSDKPSYKDIDEVLDSIRQPNTHVRNSVNRIRKLTSKDARDNVKKQLPLIIFSGEFTKRNNDSIKRGSGLMILDLDKDFSSDEELKEYKDVLRLDEHVYSCFLSPSGKGLKVLVKIPNTISNDDYNAHFDGITGYFKHFDKNNKGIVRACYASYDPDIYINKDSKVWTEKAKQSDKKRLVTPQPTTSKNTQDLSYSDEEIFTRIAIPWADRKLKGEGRNNAAYKLASLCNDYEINVEVAISLVYNEIINWPSDHTFTEKECIKTVRSAYRQPSQMKRQAAESDLASKDGISNEPVKKDKIGFADDELPEVFTEEEVEVPQFWETEGQRYNIKPNLLYDAISEAGFYRYNLTEETFGFVKIRNNFIQKTIPEAIQSTMMGHMREQDTVAFDRLYPSAKYFTAGSLHIIKKMTDDFVMLRDSSSVAMFPFKNGILATDGEHRRIIAYETNKMMIWKNEVIDHPFKMADVQESLDSSDVFAFFRKITDSERSFAGLVSGIGYMLHTYKDPANTKAIILNDLHSDGFRSNGGSGKSLVMKMVGKLRSSLVVDGKNIKQDDTRFLWSGLEPHHKALAIDDLPRGFSRESIFNITTGNIEAEKKFKDKVIIEFKDAPKIMLSTNRRLRGIDGSSERRSFEIDITDYFNVGYTPMDEYGRRFMESDWSWKDWNDFYSVMIYCLEFYFRNGLISQDSRFQKIETFKQTYGLNVYARIKGLFKPNNPKINISQLLEVTRSPEHAVHALQEYASIDGYDVRVDGSEYVTIIKLESANIYKNAEQVLKNIKW